jgi:heat shock protein HslJ
MNRLTLVGAVLFGFALAACSTAASPSASRSAAPGPEGSAAAGSTLTGVTWALGDLPGQTLAAVRPTISFSGDGTVSGSGGCNDFNGTYTVSGSTISFGQLASTKKVCGEPSDTIESTYLAALQGSTAYEITAQNELKLSGGPATLTFTVQE